MTDPNTWSLWAIQEDRKTLLGSNFGVITEPGAGPVLGQQVQAPGTMDLVGHFLKNFMLEMSEADIERYEVHRNSHRRPDQYLAKRLERAFIHCAMSIGVSTGFGHASLRGELDLDKLE